jgi:nitroimidazol reductase NimA-like FMN-containing flavoprotein (pyridoxamine 5'-phosphate oxidase superfamily)
VTSTDAITILEEHECWALLRTVAVGRLAVVILNQPDIFPVNHVVDGGRILFRTAEGTKLAAALPGQAVAYEADGYDPACGEAWSVVIKGHAVAIGMPTTGARRGSTGR